MALENVFSSSSSTSADDFTSNGYRTLHHGGGAIKHSFRAQKYMGGTNAASVSNGITMAPSTFMHKDPTVRTFPQPLPLHFAVLVNLWLRIMVCCPSKDDFNSMENRSS